MSKFFQIKQSILQILKYWPLKPQQIADKLQLSKPTSNKYLALLLQEGAISKQGSWAHIYYYSNQPYANTEKTHSDSQLTTLFNYQEVAFLDSYFFKYASDGRILEWGEWFEFRCKKRNLDPREKFKDFYKMISAIEERRTEYWLLKGDLSRYQDHKQGMDQLFFFDYYAIAEFGRGKRAEQLFFAKQHQNKNQILNVILFFIRRLSFFIEQGGFDAIALTPPSINRKWQILELLDSLLKTKLPHIHLVKRSASNILIPQKSLRSPNERIENAQKTIYIAETKIPQYQKVLLIDDFVGSGATLQETAKKLKWAGCQQVVGLAFFGNLDLKFEVINEM